MRPFQDASPCVFVPFIKVLLHNAATGRYYAGDNDWASDSELAFDLRQVERAIAFNHQQHLGATDVILAYERPPCALRIPISNTEADAFSDPVARCASQSIP